MPAIILLYCHFYHTVSQFGEEACSIKRTLRSLVSALLLSCFGNLLFCSAVRQYSQWWRKCLLPFYMSGENEWNGAYHICWASWRTQICDLTLPRFLKGLGMTSCHQTYRHDWSLSFCSCAMENVPPLSETESSGTCPKSRSLPHAAPWLSFLLVSSLSSGSFPSIFKHAQVSASLKKNKWETWILLPVLPLIFTMTVFLSHPNSLAPLLCLLFNQTFIQVPCWDLGI